MLYTSSKYAFGDFSASPAIATTSDAKAYSQTFFMPNIHDKQISHLRRWITKSAGGGVKWGAAALLGGMPTRLASKELFDVYHSHTENCSTCLAALKNMLIIRNVSLALAVIGLSIAKKLSSKIVLSSIFGVISLITHKLAKMFYSYEFSHQSNN